MQEQEFCQNALQDLVLEVCPLGCDKKCSEVWINETIGHRIVCRCKKCNHGVLAK
jgi:hypothetical protein